MLWLRTRRVVSLVCVLVVLAAVGRMFGPWRINLPAFFGDAINSFLVTTLLSLVWAAALVDTFSARRQAVEVRPVPQGRLGVSRLAWLDACLFLSAVAAAGIVGSLFLSLTGPPLIGVGPMLVVSGLGCTMMLRWGRAGGVYAVSALLFLTSMYALDSPAARYVRVLQDDGDPLWSVCCGLVLCSIATFLLLTDRVTTDLALADRLD